MLSFASNCYYYDNHFILKLSIVSDPFNGNISKDSKDQLIEARLLKEGVSSFIVYYHIYICTFLIIHVLHFVCLLRLPCVLITCSLTKLIYVVIYTF